ncbi:hypothetical protein [Yersinia massiliensis]|nr:hypothetical protein [Yersinia massiliensis]
MPIQVNNIAAGVIKIIQRAILCRKFLTGGKMPEANPALRPQMTQ